MPIAITFNCPEHNDNEVDSQVQYRLLSITKYNQVTDELRELFAMWGPDVFSYLNDSEDDQSVLVVTLEPMNTSDSAYGASSCLTISEIQDQIRIVTVNNKGKLLAPTIWNSDQTLSPLSGKAVVAFTVPQSLVTVRLMFGGLINFSEVLDLNFETLAFRTLASLCGNGVLEIGEGCDDGNIEDDDGCPSTCFIGESMKYSVDLAHAFVGTDFVRIGIPAVTVTRFGPGNGEASEDEYGVLGEASEDEYWVVLDAFASGSGVDAKKRPREEWTSDIQVYNSMGELVGLQQIKFIPTAESRNYAGGVNAQLFFRLREREFPAEIVFRGGLRAKNIFPPEKYKLPEEKPEETWEITSEERGPSPTLFESLLRKREDISEMFNNARP